MMIKKTNDKSIGQPERKMSTAQVVTMTAGIVCAIVVWFFGFRPFLVNGISMYPTFNASFSDKATPSLIAGDYLIIDAFSYHFLKEPNRFDIVVAKSPTERGKHLLKRIIGLPNEQVNLSGNTVTITTNQNQTYALYEPYINREERVMYKDQTIQLGDDQYFLLGDNRTNSLDSRVWGALPGNRIVGRVLLRLYPFNEVSIMPGNIDTATTNVL